MRSTKYALYQDRRRMMATEATQENFADASSNLPEKQQNVLTEPSQDVPTISPPPTVNGEASTDSDKPQKDGVPQSTSAAASISGGSDTEASKGENSKLRADDKGISKTSSVVKKPTTFKAVTVNKTFLAAKGATGAAASKPGENKPVAGSAAVQTGPSISAAPRPRLVAKTGSGLRDSAPRSLTSANGGKPGSAPDGNAVWNKNRAAPAPAVKHLTDEDLRKQYGIHLATRIQGDDTGKQANWADIDEDEEDWAPETIEWTDGTKITLHQADEPAPAPAEQAKPKASIASEMSKPQSPAPLSSTTSTVRLGGISGGPGKGLILKGAAEKPTLVAKPPGPPTPVKSPWAPLPPVDKVAPVVIEPQSSQLPHQQSVPRFHSKDPHGFESMPPRPTKEIAADDFSRGSRDNSHNQNRELYNSQSGRYEPVTDTRRNSRNDNSRQPALLQRPSHHDQQGPAEPSGAFQTHRTSGEASYGGRRRNSSNVSGGSGNVGRRISFSKGGDMPTSHEMTDPRRGSLAAVSDSPSSPRNFSPAAQQHPAPRSNSVWQSRASPATSHTSPNLIHGQMLPPPIPSDKQPYSREEELRIQEQIMVATREAARKRRMDLEAKEEAEKKERIRLKLEAMGPPPESNKQKKDALAGEKATPTQIQVRDPAEVPSKAVAPEISAEAKQPSVAEDIQNPASQASFEQDRDGQKASAKDLVLNRPAPLEDRRTVSDHVLPPSHSNSGSQPWQNAQQTNRFPAWNGNSQSSTTRNVWGAHGIGNGSFGIQDTATSQGAVGPPGPYRANSQQNSRGREPYSNRPAPIGPPNGQTGPQRTLRPATQPQISGVSAWANFNVAESDKELAARRAEDAAIKKEREAIEGVKEPERVDTWKQVAIQANGERTKIKTVATTVKPGSILSAPAMDSAPPARLLGTGPLPPNGVRHDINGPVSSNTVSVSGMTTQRGSRFFPNRDVRLEDVNHSFGRSSSPSPPPPTMAGHPAYDGDVSHPLVCLPRPPPVVKLPPTKLAPIGPPKPAASFAAAVAGPSSHSFLSSNTTAQPMRQDAPLRGQYPSSGVWQDKISNLLNRKPSPPKSYALAVDSSSKRALEISEVRSSATVTLPGSRSDVPWESDDSSFTTKPMSEECFEEQEMGSRPVCILPRVSAYGDFLSRPANPNQIKPGQQRPRAVEATSSKILPFLPDRPDGIKGRPVIVVYVSEHIPKKFVPAPFLENSRQRSNPRRGGPRGGSTRGNYNNRGGRREASSSYSSPKMDNALSSSSNTHSTRGRGRGYSGSNWTTAARHVSTPVTSN